MLFFIFFTQIFPKYLFAQDIFKTKALQVAAAAQFTKNLRRRLIQYNKHCKNKSTASRRRRSIH
jgi:hypothetical protein